jgi:hypothetical protein
VKLEITPEAYSTICDNLRSAISAAGLLRGCPTTDRVDVLASRIETCLAKCQGELGGIIIKKGGSHVAGTRAGVVAGQPGAGGS